MDRLFDLLFGCRRRRLSRPLTTTGPGRRRQTCVVRLDCGKRLACDLQTMRVGRRLDG